MKKAFDLSKIKITGKGCNVMKQNTPMGELLSNIYTYGLSDGVDRFNKIKIERQKLNDNYMKLFKNIGLFPHENSWVQYLGKKETKAYITVFLRISDDIYFSTIEEKLPILAERTVTTYDENITLKSAKIQTLGLEKYVKYQEKDPHYLQHEEDFFDKRKAEGDKKGTTYEVPASLSRIRVYYNNRVLELRFLKENIPHTHFKPTKPPTPHSILIGETLDYETIWWDWSKDINMFLAGTTGSGKSTLVNYMIINMLFFNNVMVFLIDRKYQEFLPYAFKKNVVMLGRSSEEADIVVLSFYEEFQKRLKIMAGDLNDSSVPHFRKLETYNKRYKNEPEKQLQEYVLIIDEIMDYVLANTDKNGKIAKDTPLEKILDAASKIRSTGGHIIISTQRPSADVLPGLLKAQFGAALGLKVINGLNSEIVLDQKGLENLPNHFFKIRKNGRITDGMCLWADDTLLDKYIDEIPNRGEGDYFIDIEKVKKERLENIEELTAELEQVGSIVEVEAALHKDIKDLKDKVKKNKTKKVDNTISAIDLLPEEALIELGKQRYNFFKDLLNKVDSEKKEDQERI